MPTTKNTKQKTFYMSAFVSLTPINDLDQPSIKFVLETNNKMPKEKKVKDISLSGLLNWQFENI